MKLLAKSGTISFCFLFSSFFKIIKKNILQSSFLHLSFINFTYIEYYSKYQLPSNLNIPPRIRISNLFMHHKLIRQSNIHIVNKDEAGCLIIFWRLQKQFTKHIYQALNKCVRCSASQITSQFSDFCRNILFCRHCYQLLRTMLYSDSW